MSKKHEKQYKILSHTNRGKLEKLVYFEINHEGWEPLGGVQVVSQGSEFLWVQTLWLPKPYWPEITESTEENRKSSSEMMG